ncbi:hypothetical protein TL16_g01975 [Triparma laevis f. inornata]|uniref:Uncharacterized protein n=2 Tax=Triparma laevis TaxID=1534972 RepID=A0A9W7KXA0_9STRA|nr:hypothetical protein TL16_g01975 [Triparma laevis f. inornata]GMI15183.1 hypothetical protein TrLO_g9833 [Triparma laevis f. longispina]
MLHGCGSSTSSCLPSTLPSVLSTFTALTVPTSPPTSPLDLHSISTGINHACAVTKSGELYSWGNGVTITTTAAAAAVDSTVKIDNNDGDNASSSSSSTPLPSPPPTTFQPCPLPPSLASSLPNLTAITLPTRPHILSCSCGSHHTLLVTQSGLLHTFGSNTHAQLGHDFLENTTTPKVVEALKDKTIVGAVAGSAHTLCLTLQGTVYAFGRNSEAQLGSTKYLKRTTPLPANSFEGGRNWISKVTFYRDEGGGFKEARGIRITSLAASTNGHASFAISESGTSYWWGKLDSTSTDLNDIERLPREIPFFKKSYTKMIAAGSTFCVIVNRDGTVWAMGKEGPWLGVGPNCRWKQERPSQVMLEGDLLINGVACGEKHVILTSTEGNIWACGEGEFGRLGVREGVEKASDRVNSIPRESEEGWEKIGAEEDGKKMEEEEEGRKGRRKMKRRNIMIAAGANHTLVYESITEFED